MNLHKRLQKLKSRHKHLRGRHDQRDHNRWPSGYVAQSYVPVGGRRGSFMAGGGIQGIAQDVSLESQTVAPRSRPRPERRATLPMQYRFIPTATKRRKIAMETAAEYRRRHRMKEPTAKLQGVVSPTAMRALRGDAFWDMENPDANLFQNPRLIKTKDADGNEINLYDTFYDFFDAVASGARDRMIQDGVNEEDADDLIAQMGGLLESRFEAVMKKAAATFAADLQGFVGGQVYGNDNPEFQAAMGMASDANRSLQTQLAWMESLYDDMDESPQYAMMSDATKKFIRNGLSTEASDDLINDFGAAERDASPITTRRLASANPALVADIFERRIESPSGVQANTERSRLDAISKIPLDSLPITDTSTQMASIESILPFLHPKIRRQLLGIAAAKTTQYPTTANPSGAIKRLRNQTYAPLTQSSVTAAKSIIDELHTDGGIADIAMSEVSGPQIDYAGAYSGMRGGFMAQGLPDVNNPYIIMNPDGIRESATNMGFGDAPEIAGALTMLHEFGHAIDMSALVFGEKYWRDGVSLFNAVGSTGAVPQSMPSKAPMVAPIMRIINRWRASNLARMQEDLSFAEANGFPPEHVSYLRRMMSYHSQPNEIIARLYEQWGARAILRKLKNGDKIPGVPEYGDDIRDGAIKRLQWMYDHPKPRLAQYFSDTDMDASEADLKEIFAIMGWEMK